MNEDLAALVADLDSLAGLWRKAATTTDRDLGPHAAGYDAALLLCARQLRKALAQVRSDA